MIYAKCHPSEPHKAHGWCEKCYQYQRYSPKLGRQYGKELVEYLDTHRGTTWTELSSKMGGRTRETLLRALKTQHRPDLIERVDADSGGLKTPEKYGDKMERLIETQPGLSWGDLSQIFERTPAQLKNLLRQRKRLDLIWLVSNNDKEML